MNIRFRFDSLDLIRSWWLLCHSHVIIIRDNGIDSSPGDLISAPWVYGYGHIPPGFTTYAANCIEVSWCVAVGSKTSVGVSNTAGG